ncbi:MAG: hypothetical protein FD163_707 [Hyphomonadaceae bacterium]|nr:MAG: hypothetical protein FD128_928 [Hyphomonadaceae bacterium]KAF0186039.1 MAG: hypothetical protein FD163_707 [Hyphomonadaceae bacterium]
MTLTTIRKAFFPILICALLLAQACFAQPVQNQIFDFARTDEGEWVTVNNTDELEEYLDTSRVSCSANSSEIEFTWAAESGDWVVYDKYSSNGTFFSRTIRFAASEHIIEMTKHSRNSRSVVKVGGNDIAHYDFLLTEPKIITESDAFPFPLPNCASTIFTRR